MKKIREKIVEKLYEQYEIETAHQTFACKKGCSTCCTQNVTMTATEGEMIINFLVQEKRLEELHDILCKSETVYVPQKTPNNPDDEQVDSDEKWDLTPCCFLKNNMCSIYPARPFACRCFYSTKECGPEQPAELSAWLAAFNGVMLQLIEHVGQGELWGSMNDILLELSSQSRYIGREWRGEPTKIDRARFRLLTAGPVKEFIVDPLSQRKIELILQRISQTAIDNATIGSMLGM